MSGKRRQRAFAKDTSLVTWRDSQTQLIQRNFEAFKKIIEIENGQPVSHEWFKTDAYKHILSSTVQLAGIESIHLKRGLVGKAVFRVRTLKRQDLATFRHVLAAEVRRYLRRPTQEYHVVMPFNVDPNSLTGRRWFNVLGVRLKVRTWSYVQEHFSLPQWADEVRFHLPGYEHAFGDPFIPLVATVVDRSFREAFDRAIDAFDLLRAVLNLTERFGRFNLQLGGRPRPLGRVLPSPVYGVFKANGDYEALFFNEIPPDIYERQPISRDRLERTNRLLRHLKPPTTAEDTSHLALNALRKYGQALDTADWREAFLSLWQALEVMTYRPSERYSMDDVCERAAILLGQGPLLRDLLWVSRDTRNAMVHRGRFSDDGLIDVNMLKAVVERCIAVVDARRRMCPNWNTLLIFFRNAAAQPRDLAERAKVINSIRRLHGRADQRHRRG